MDIFYSTKMVTFMQKFKLLGWRKITSLFEKRENLYLEYIFCFFIIRLVIWRCFIDQAFFLCSITNCGSCRIWYNDRLSYVNIKWIVLKCLIIPDFIINCIISYITISNYMLFQKTFIIVIHGHNSNKHEIR